MNSALKFQSEIYTPINWLSILRECCELQRVQKNVAISSAGWVLFPGENILSGEILILTKSGCLTVSADEIIIEKNEFLESSGLKIARLPSSYRLDEYFYLEDDYYSVCSKVCEKSILSAKIILQYLYDHLDNREADTMKIIQHESVKFLIANIVINIEASSKLLSVSKNILSLNKAFDYLLKALRMLSELGGGRSILRGNAIEFIFHMRIFKDLFCNAEEYIND